MIPLHRYALIASLLCASAGAQTFVLGKTGGTLGKALRLELQGPAGKAAILLPSLNAGPTPLKLFDGKDPRSLSVGLDLISLYQLVVLGPGTTTLSLPLPNDTSLASKRIHFQAFTIPGKVYLAGLLSNDIVSTLGTGGTWVQRGKLLKVSRAMPAMAPLPGGSVILIGGGSGSLLNGSGLSSTEIYDPARQTWRPGPNMASARGLLTATALKNGKILVVGGANSAGVLKTCELYDPKTNKFSPTGSLSVPRAGHTASLLPDGRVLITGGLSDISSALKAVGSMKKSTEIYDPKTGRFSAGPNMSRERIAHTASLLPNGKILIAGGISLNGFFRLPGMTSRCEIFDPKTNRFSGASSLPFTTAAHSQIRLKSGRILVAGGARSSLLITDAKPIKDAARFDPTTGRWTRVGSMAVARTLPSLARLAGGKILVIGGAQGTLDKPTATARCEVFDPATARFGPATSLGISRAGAPALSLREGQIMVVGGGTGQGSKSIDTGEMYFPK
ncbi:MAG TPA: hypothetical protein ENK02_12960 [Planctomycetes bacterium]|nr:hypothetical protein [Planctomycetota bacterium]